MSRRLVAVADLSPDQRFRHPATGSVMVAGEVRPDLDGKGLTLPARSDDEREAVALQCGNGDVVELVPDEGEAVS